MNEMKKQKQKLAGLLAAVLVFTMTVPALSGYAEASNTVVLPEQRNSANSDVKYGDTVHMKFNPGIGPGLSRSRWGAVSGLPAGESDITGAAGNALTAQADGLFNRLVQAGVSEERGGRLRPAIPDYDPIWQGYTFEGWYNGAGNKITYLPYAFPYETSTTYTARWSADVGTTFPFTLQYYRDLNPGRSDITDSADPAAWPSQSGGDYDNPKQVRKFYETDWLQGERSVDTPISAGFRPVPGYMIKDVIMKNNQFINFDGQPLEGTESVHLLSDSKAIKGSMPNAPLTVAFRYVPDPSRQFRITVKYVAKETDETGRETNTEIRPADTYFYSAEADYKVAPPEPNEMKGYLLERGELTNAGVSDPAVRGIISAQDAAAATAAGTIGYDKQTRVFTGPMPNQPIEFTYIYEKDPEYKIPIIVHRQDNHHIAIEADEVMNAVKDHPITIQVNAVKSYKYTPPKQGETYPTQPALRYQGLQVSYNQKDNTHGELIATPVSEQGGTVTLTYTEDTGADDYYAKINLYGPGGVFKGAFETPFYVSLNGRIRLLSIQPWVKYRRR